MFVAGNLHPGSVYFGKVTCVFLEEFNLRSTKIIRWFSNSKEDIEIDYIYLKINLRILLPKNGWKFSRGLLEF